MRRALVLVVAVAVLLLVAAGVYVWAQIAFGGELVRGAVASQLSRTLGQRVQIASVRVAVWPRVALRLENVRVGDDDRLTVQTLEVSTQLRGLLSRRLEHATLRATGTRVVLPLPAFTLTGQDGSDGATPAMRIVSVDQIAFEQLTVVGNGVELRADVDLVPDGTGLLVRRVALGAGDAMLDVSGRIDNLAGPVGRLTVRTTRLDLIAMLAYVTAFTPAPSPTATSEPVHAAAATPLDLTLDLQVDRVALGTLVFDALKGRGHVTA
jgi:hypothetical protein